jgi:hypothetical protein
MVIVVVGEFAPVVACLLLGHARGSGMPGLVTGAKVFLPLWLPGAPLNLWIGVSQAGYFAAQEARFFLASSAFQRPPCCGGSFPDTRTAEY